MKKRNLKSESTIAEHCTFWNKERILDSNQCGCFVCNMLFSPELIEKWIHEISLSDNTELATAICPYCYGNTIIPESTEYTLDKDLLEYMHKKDKKKIKKIFKKFFKHNKKSDKEI